MDLFPKRKKKIAGIRFFYPGLIGGGILLLICILLLLNSNLPDPPTDGGRNGGPKTKRKKAEGEESRIGTLGETMVRMLPDDLPFTVFVPSSESFKTVLNIIEEPQAKSNLSNDTLAILSRLMGFSTVPHHLLSQDLLISQKQTFDSVSGFKLRVNKKHLKDGRTATLVVNSINSIYVDIRMPKTDTIVHIMDGVIMDPQFALSF
ncbi:Fasciclin-like domain-containing protein [Zostera marina]|uniref:Fasciclin-like domain-containing protein n=1 Tax=Zostera marina TaxID=29655 RepID=A0A0K9PHE7_ZOSMR|nr:Fasciclin-like domain-containing protein [Zostera marina]